MHFLSLKLHFLILEDIFSEPLEVPVSLQFFELSEHNLSPVHCIHDL